MTLLRSDIEESLAYLSDMTCPEEVASVLKVSSRTVANMCTNGKIKGIKFGKLWRIPKRFLIDYLEVANATK